MVGDGLALLALALLAAPALVALHLSRSALAVLDLPRVVTRIIGSGARKGMLMEAAAGALLLALVAVRLIAPPRGAELPSSTIVRSLRGLCAGLGICAGGLIGLSVNGRIDDRFLVGTGRLEASDVAILLFLETMTLAGFAAVFIALRGILAVIGERSREYRTSVLGRQPTRELALATAAVAAGEALRVILASTRIPDIRLLGTVLSAVAGSMLLIGLVYFFVNMLWIRRSLHRPPPTIEDLVTPDDSATLADQPHSSPGR